MEVNVVGNAVCSEGGGYGLEVGVATTLVPDIGNGHGRVHPEEDCVTGQVVCEGLDGEEGGEEFKGVDVVLLGDSPVVE